MPNTIAATAPMINWFAFALLPVKLVVHMATIKPIVPHTRMGGKTLTTSNLLSFKIVYAIEFDREIVGM